MERILKEQEVVCITNLLVSRRLKKKKKRRKVDPYSGV